MKTRLPAILLSASLAMGAPTQAAQAAPPAAARQQQQQALPPGVTRMSARDRMTQCHEMMIPILDQIEKRERPLGAPATGHSANDRQADEMAMAELQDCHDLLGDLIARLERAAPATVRRR
jgi:hypothetical protein